MGRGCGTNELTNSRPCTRCHPRPGSSRTGGSGGATALRPREPRDGPRGPPCYTPPSPRHVRGGQSRPSPAGRRNGAHTRTPARTGRCPGPAELRRHQAPVGGPRRIQPQEAASAHRVHAPAPRGRRPLRTPDPSLEPEDEALHLRGAQRDPHHRPGPDASSASTRRSSSSRRPSRAATTCSSWARRSRRRSRSCRRPSAPASRSSPSAGSAA